MIFGDNNGRFPHCHSYLSINDEEITIFDPQCGISLLEKGLNILQKSWKDIKHIINTHFHADHTASNGYIKEKNPDVQIMIHKDDAEAMKSAKEYFRHYGLDNQVNIQYKSIFNNIGYREIIPNNTFKDGDLLPGDFNVIHSPGHTPGHSCFYKSNILISGDIDCTKPWFGNVTSDVDNFLNSVNKIMKLNIDSFLPGHGKPMFESDRIQSELGIYREKVFETELKILNLINGNLQLEEIINRRNQGKNLPFWRQSPLMELFRKYETLNYLIHLQETGRISRVKKEGLILWVKK